MADETEEGTEGAPGAAASPEGGSSSFSEADFKERARRDPDWAWEQVRGFQSRADKAQGAEEKYSKLVQQMGNAKQLIEAYGGDVIATATQNYVALRNHEALGETVQTFERTGQIPTRKGIAPKEEDMDEYMTPEEKEIKGLKAELEQVKAGLSVQSFATAKTTLEKHMQEVFGEFGFEPEHVDKIRNRVVQQFTSWAKNGRAGELALEGLTGPNGKETIRGIMLSGISTKELLNAAANVNLRKKSALSDLDTDGPSGIRSTGKELPSKFASYIELAKAVRANPENFDSR